MSGLSLGVWPDFGNFSSAQASFSSSASVQWISKQHLVLLLPRQFLSVFYHGLSFLKCSRSDLPGGVYKRDGAQKDCGLLGN